MLNASLMLDWRFVFKWGIIVKYWLILGYVLIIGMKPNLDLLIQRSRLLYYFYIRLCLLGLYKREREILRERRVGVLLDVERWKGELLSMLDLIKARWLWSCTSRARRITTLVPRFFTRNKRYPCDQIGIGGLKGNLAYLKGPNRGLNLLSMTKRLNKPRLNISLCKFMLYTF